MSDPFWYKHERWSILNWLSSDHDPADPDLKAPFEADLVALYAEFRQNHILDAYQLFRHMAQDLFLTPLPLQATKISQRQSARFWYVAAHIAIVMEEPLNAYDRLVLAEEHTPLQDIISRLQIASWKGYMELSLNLYRSAFATYSFLINLLESKDTQLTFIRGDHASFLCNGYRQRAKVRYKLGQFAEQETDLLRAMQLINTWVIDHSPAFRGQSPEALAQQLHLEVTHQLLILPLTALEPANILDPNKRDRTLINWIELYHNIPWDYAYHLMGRYRIYPDANMIGVWQDAHTMLIPLVSSYDHLLESKAAAARMSLLGAELALAILEYTEAAEGQQTWLTHAQADLDMAKKVLDEFERHDQIIDKDLPYLYWLIQHKCDLWRLDYEHGETVPTESLQTMLDDVAGRCNAAHQKGDILQIEGRCHFLMGEILTELSELHQAFMAYHRALAIFEPEPNDPASGDFPRSKETRRAIAQLEPDSPEE